VRRACLSTSGERVLCGGRAVVGVQRGSRIPAGGGRQAVNGHDGEREEVL
jgi:hypothetical protein